MIDYWIIQDILRKEKERAAQDAAFLELPLHRPRGDYYGESGQGERREGCESETGVERGVTIIECG